MVQEWAQWASCNVKLSALFYADPKQKDAIEAAKKICRDCPVLFECRDYAFRVETPATVYGVQGGLSADERRSIMRRQARVRHKSMSAIQRNQNSKPL